MLLPDHGEELVGGDELDLASLGKPPGILSENARCHHETTNGPLESCAASIVSIRGDCCQVMVGHGGGIAGEAPALQKWRRGREKNKAWRAEAAPYNCALRQLQR